MIMAMAKTMGRQLTEDRVHEEELTRLAEAKRHEEDKEEPPSKR